MNINTSQREQEILRELRLAGGSSRITYLARRLDVSDETIRRNIRSLEAKGLAEKNHGGVVLTGAVSRTEQPFQARMDENATVKKVLAYKVAQMIKDGDSLFLDIASTTAYVAEALTNHRDLFIVTNSMAVANTLAGKNNNRVFFAGGELRAHDGGSFGLDAIRFIQRFTFQYAILSVTAVRADIGFMLHDVPEADLSCEAARRAQTRIIVADSEKMGRRAPIALPETSQFDILVTDKTPDAAIAEMLKKNEINVVLPNSLPLPKAI